MARGCRRGWFRAILSDGASPVPTSVSILPALAIVGVRWPMQTNWLHWAFILTLVANLSNGALLKTTALLFISHNHFRRCLPFRHSVFLVETKNCQRLMWSPLQKWLLVGVNWLQWAFILTLVANLSDGALLKTIAFLCISHNHFRKRLPFRHSVFLVETTKSWKRLMWSPWQKHLLVGVTK